MNYCESRIFDNGTRFTYVDFDTYNLHITECSCENHVEVIRTDYDSDLKLESPEPVNIGYYIYRGLGAPVELKDYNHPRWKNEQT